MDKQKKNMGAVAFLPLIVFLVCYVGCGITFTLLGADEPFGKFPRHVALLAGCAVALLLNRGMGVQDKLNIMTTNMGNSGVMMIVLIYLMAGGFQGAAAAMGGKDSVVNLCLHFIPVKLLVPGVFLMCCFISTSIGTSGSNMMITFFILLWILVVNKNLVVVFLVVDCYCFQSLS